MVTSPRKTTTSRLACTRATVSLPTRAKKDSRAASRRAPARSGTAAARLSRRRTPSGRPLASVSRPAPRAKPSNRRRNMSRPLSQPVRSCASTRMRRTPLRPSSSSCDLGAGGRGPLRRQLPDSRRLNRIRRRGIGEHLITGRRQVVHALSKPPTRHLRGADQHAIPEVRSIDRVATLGCAPPGCKAAEHSVSVRRQGRYAAPPTAPPARPSCRARPRAPSRGRSDDRPGA